MVEVRGDREYPRAMLSDFRMLYAEPEVLYESAEKQVESFLKEVESDDESANLQKVVEDMVRTVSELTSPLGMARSLLTLLILAERTDESISFRIDDHEWTLREWIGEFVDSTLYRGKGQTSEEVSPVRDRHYKEIHAIALRLGANVAGNDKYLEKWHDELGDEEEVLLQWIQSTMLFASRIIPFLVGRFGATPELREILDELIRDLNVAYDEPVATPDRFNPFLLGPHLLDHEVAAVLYVLSIFVERCERPSDVLDLGEVQSLVEQWTEISGAQAEEVYEAQKEDAHEVIDLQMPLSPRSAASRLVESIASRSG